MVFNLCTASATSTIHVYLFYKSKTKRRSSYVNMYEKCDPNLKSQLESHLLENDFIHDLISLPNGHFPNKITSNHFCPIFKPILRIQTKVNSFYFAIIILDCCCTIFMILSLFNGNSNIILETQQIPVDPTISSNLCRLTNCLYFKSNKSKAMR